MDRKVVSILKHQFVYFVAVLVGVLVVAILAGFLLSFVVGDRDSLTNEQNRQIAPTASVIKSQGENQVKWWDVQVDRWLTPSESERLRGQLNVNNLMILHPDEVSVAANQTLYLDEGWVQRRPYFVETVTLDGTAVSVQIGGRVYQVNVYMPFVWRSAPEQITMLDGEGRIWTLLADDIQLSDVGSHELPIVINPNPELEIAH